MESKEMADNSNKTNKWIYVSSGNYMNTNLDGWLNVYRSIKKKKR
jgi:hypothetical protein